jgi:uncharacterized membrane-anchored protein
MVHREYVFNREDEVNQKIEGLMRSVHMTKSWIDNKHQVSSVLAKVPEITLLFWITKLLTTGMGEVFSDYLVVAINPFIAVALGGIGLVASLILQFKTRRYVAWIYWLVVVMVSIFGTMVADVAHIVLGIPYLVSTVVFTLLLAIVFLVWFKVEKTLSIHSVYTFKREIFYWATVLVTFALGTATGDLTAANLHLGYFMSGVLFAILIALPAIGFRWFRLNGIFAFWFAYIMTRPAGASFSDWLSKSSNFGGLGMGEGKISLILTLIIIVLVTYLQITQSGVRYKMFEEKSR